MKKLSISVAALLVALSVWGGTVNAQQVCTGGNESTNCQVLDPVCRDNPQATLCEDNANTSGDDVDNNAIFGPDGLITNIAQIIVIITGIASVLMIIMSGIQYTISSGDPARLNTAKNTLLFAIIGMIIALMAQSIIVFVLNNL